MFLLVTYIEQNSDVLALILSIKLVDEIIRIDKFFTINLDLLHFLYVCMSSTGLSYGCQLNSF